MVYQKRCPRLAQGPVLVSSVALPQLADLVSPNKPDSALHPQSLQGRDRGNDTSPKSTASSSNTPVVCANSLALPSLERTALVQGYPDPS